MSKNKMSKDVVPNDFNMALVLVDAIPVVFFGLSMILISLILTNKIFIIGALLVLFAGICKVLWKLIVVLKKKNIWFLFMQMRIIMPIGMLIMLVSVFIIKPVNGYSLIWQTMSSFPSALFFIFGIIAMVMMIYFAFNLDGANLKANWIEQLTNGFAQICFFIGLLNVLLKM